MEGHGEGRIGHVFELKRMERKGDNALSVRAGTRPFLFGREVSDCRKAPRSTEEGGGGREGEMTSLSGPGQCKKGNISHIIVKGNTEGKKKEGSPAKGKKEGGNT